MSLTMNDSQFIYSLKEPSRLQLIQNMNQQRFDQFFLTICREVGGIEGFVKSFFDFLFRKTDFFYECDPGDKMGFPPGYNKQLIFGIMEQFQKQHYKKVPQKSIEEFNKKVEAAKAKQQQSKKITQPVQQIQPQKQIKKENVIKKPIQPTKIVEEPKKETQIKPIVNTYNGGTNQKYSWSQQIRQVEVTIEVEPSLTSKMIDVKLKNDRISIKKKTGELIAEGELVEKINSAESIWKIQKSGNKTFITLNLEKAEQKIWSTVFKGDPEIDTTKVNNTKPLQQFDDQTQGAIRKIMYEQQRKQMGLPTTEQETQLNALKQAWDAEGSPFKGQPFDPSLINFNGGQPGPQI